MYRPVALAAALILSTGAAAQEPDRQFEAALQAAQVPAGARTLKIREDGLGLFAPPNWQVESQQTPPVASPGGGTAVGAGTRVMLKGQSAQCSVAYPNEPTRENPPHVLRNMASSLYRTGADRNTEAALGMVSSGTRQAAYSRVLAANRQAQVVRAYAYRDRRLVQVTCTLRQLTPLGAADDPETVAAYRVINGAIWP